MSAALAAAPVAGAAGPAAAVAAAVVEGPYASEGDRAALAEVLSRPEFRDRLADGLALRRLLLGWWDRFLGLLETPEAERYAVLGRAVFLAAVAAAALLLWRALRRRATSRATRAGARPDPADSGTRAGPDPTAGLDAAARALDAGELARAVRAAYGAAAALPSIATIAGEAGAALTGPELAATCGDPGFAELARLHERTVFGRRPVAREEAARSVAEARRLVAGTPGPDRPAAPHHVEEPSP